MGTSKVAAELNRRVALRTGQPVRVVREVTSTLVDALIEELVGSREVIISRLGRLRVVTSRVNRTVPLPQKNGAREIEVEDNLRVYFSKSHNLARRLKESHGKTRRSRRR